jgi:hypothetical protein
MFQGDFRAIQLGRRQRTHAWGAARPLDGSNRLTQSGMLGRRGAAGDERREHDAGRGGSRQEQPLAQETHRATLGSGIVATRRDAAVLLLDPLAQAASLRLCLRGLGFDLSQLRIHQGLLC